MAKIVPFHEQEAVTDLAAHASSYRWRFCVSSQVLAYMPCAPMVASLDDEAVRLERALQIYGETLRFLRSIPST